MELANYLNANRLMVDVVITLFFAILHWAINLDLTPKARWACTAIGFTMALASCLLWDFAHPLK